MVDALVQFGVAGLMGMLWIWERMHSRRREAQLSETHQRLMDREKQLEMLVKLVRQNTEALVRFERIQKRMCDLLEGIKHEMRNRDRTA
jgi:hypothetical protein